VTKSFYLGVEVLYDTMKSATLATGAGFGGYAAATNVTGAESSASAWIVSVRAHRDFLP